LRDENTYPQTVYKRFTPGSQSNCDIKVTLGAVFLSEIRATQEQIAIVTAVIARSENKQTAAG
jgi:hypothetical protein